MRWTGRSLHGPRNRSQIGVWAVIGTQTTSKLHTSYNVASLTDNGTGDSTLTFVVPFASASEYAVVCGTTSTSRVVTFTDQDNRPTASSVRLVTIDAANALTDVDPTTVICVGRR